MELRDRIVNDFPNVNVLINNAAVLDLPNKLTEFSDQDWQKSLALTDTNLLAAVHSFTQSLRHQLKGTKVLVVEIAPPLVDTDMVHADLKGQGVAPNVFVSDVVGQILVGGEEVTYHSDDTLRGTRE
eukprot:gene39081-48269_t